MKKTYIQPTMKVVEVQQRQMLCGSTLGINNDEEVSEEVNEFFGYNGYGKAW